MNQKKNVALPDGYLDFFSSLKAWQKQQESQLSNINFGKLENPLIILSQRKKPLTSIAKFNIDPQLYDKVFKALLVFMSENRPAINNQINKLSTENKEWNFTELALDLLNNKFENINTAATQYDLSPDLLIFLLDHSLRPFLRLFARPYNQELNEDTFQYWDFPNLCPVCGSKSYINRIRVEDNRRFMFCDRCFTQWEARYLYCAYCGNDEPGSIKYFSLENDDAFQIYTCDKCKGYIKIYDERVGIRNKDLYIANLESVHLDLLAQEKGYTNHDN